MLTSALERENREENLSAHRQHGPSGPRRDPCPAAGDTLDALLDAERRALFVVRDDGLVVERRVPAELSAYLGPADPPCPLDAALVPAAAAAVAAACRAAGDNPWSALPFVLTGPGGAHRSVARALPLAGGLRLAVIAEDVAAGPAAGPGLEERLRAILATEPECLKVISIGGELLEMNRAGLDILEVADLEQARERPLLEYVVPEHREQFLRVHRQALAGETATLDFELEGRRGTRRWMQTRATPLRNSDGTVGAVLAITTDLTARHRAEAALLEACESLRRSEERFRTLIERASDIVSLLDPGGRILFASPAVENLLGYAPDEVVGKPIFDLVAPEDPADAERTLAALQTPGAEVRLVVRTRRKDGAVRWLLGHARNLSHVPAVGGIVANARDITDERRLTEQLQQAQRLESVGRLAGGIAHDFNNLLTTILGFGELLAARLPPELGADRELGEIRRAGDRARDLTQQLLAFARRQVHAARPLALDEVARRAAPLMRQVLREDIALELALCGQPLTVMVDPARLEQALVCLAANARDAMPRGGTFRLATSACEVAAGSRQAAAGLVPGTHACLEVTDTGPGMPPEVLARAFEPFFTTKPVGQGPGLGLATVWGIVKQSSGHIEVESEAERGTTFRLYLPLAGKEVAAGGAGAAGAAAGASAARTVVLVAEDDPAVRSLTAQVLCSAGFEVVEAADGNEALSAFRRADPPIELVVTDVVMPRLGGPELVSELRRSRPGLPAVFVSGYTGGVQAPLPADGAPSAFLAKPFAASALVAAVRDLMSRPAEGAPGGRT